MYPGTCRLLKAAWEQGPIKKPFLNLYSLTTSSFSLIYSHFLLLATTEATSRQNCSMHRTYVNKTHHCHARTCKKAFGLFSKVAHNCNFCVKGVLAAAEAERSLEFTWASHVERGKRRAVQYQLQGWKVTYQKPRSTFHLYILVMYDCKKVPDYWRQSIFQIPAAMPYQKLHLF